MTRPQYRATLSLAVALAAVGMGTALDARSALRARTEPQGCVHVATLDQRIAEYACGTVLAGDDTIAGLTRAYVTRTRWHGPWVEYDDGMCTVIRRGLIARAFGAEDYACAAATIALRKKVIRDQDDRRG